MTRLACGWAWTTEGLKSGVQIAIEDGRIQRIETQPGPVDLDLPHHILLPGFVNAHSHAFQRAFRGHVQWSPQGEDNFWSWRTRMYATAEGLNPASIEAISALAFLEMAESGYTHVGEFHYVHHAAGGAPYEPPDLLANRVIEAALRVGIRITLLRVAYGRGGHGVPISPAQRRFIDPSPQYALDAARRLQEHHQDPRVTVGLAAHSVRALDASWLRTLSAWPGVVHAHVSEQPAENEACLAEHGCSPTQLLVDSGIVSPRFTAVHLTWPMEGDVDRLVQAGGGLCVCPTTELDLGDGFAPVDALRRLPTSLGTDSHASINPFVEARSLELHARGATRQRNVLGEPGHRHSLAERLLENATIDGSRALGAPPAGIAQGAPADLVAVDLSKTGALGVPPLEALVFAAEPSWVDHVWVAGTPIISNGVHAEAASIRGAALRYL